MDKEKIKKELNGAIARLKNICNDAHHADELIKNILSLKGQYDVKEVELIVEKDQTIKEYDFNSFRFIRNRKGILLHNKGGYDLFVKPTMRTLYGHLETMLNYKDKYEELTEEEKTVYDALLSATYSVCTLPCNVFLDDIFAFDIASRYIEFIQKEEDKLLNADLQEETYAQDQDFADKIEMVENLKDKNNN